MWLILSSFLLVGIGSILGQPIYGIMDIDLKTLPDVPEVVISQGTVVGSLSTNGSYAEFYGIPYADATSGINRFKAPNPAPSFSETFVANRRDVKCIRALGSRYEGTEDCLVANVFTPTLNSTQQLPVMVWVKGKELNRVSDQEISYGNFVEKDVVVVTLNYRESIFGYLCLGTETAPGNAGLKDLVAGLRWVKENIAQFGGNPDDITLIGHGSGAAAVDLMTMSPMTDGLIHKAIVQSGNALAPWAVTRDNLEYAVQIAEALGHEITTVEQLFEIFTRTSVAALMAIINELDLTDNSLAFAPCIEREELEGGNPFLVKSPFEILRNGDFLQIPLIIGYVDNEGTIRSEEAVENNWLSRMDQSFNKFLQPDLKFENAQEQSQIAQILRSRYFANDPISMEHIENYISYYGDTMILVSTLREIRLRVTASDSPVHVYQFSYKGSVENSFAGPLPVESAAHGEELAYMFVDIDDTMIPDRDLVVADILVERWTNFAKFGSPHSETSNILWRPFTSFQAFFLRFIDSNEITDEATVENIIQNPYTETMSFWDDIYAEHFLDATGRWDLTELEDEIIDEVTEETVTEIGEGVTDSPSSETDEDDVDDDVDVDDDDDEEEDTNDDETNSASTSAGHTFLITSLFTIFNIFMPSS